LLQQADWDCAQESIRWTLFAYGRTPDNAWMESSMIAAGVVNPSVGCTDASGAGLAGWVNAEYGEYGYLASNQTGVSFDAVAEEAARHVHPLAMGGAGWYHWTAVRGHDALMDRLLLANPAPGYGGCYQTMDRAQFANLGPFNLVRVTHPEAEGGGDGGGAQPTGMAYGPDVSSHQGYVDWAAVRSAGCSFGFTKASGGAWYQNPTLAANWQGMAAAGLTRGCYHFAFESSGQPLPGPGAIAEADYFLSTVLPLGLARGDMLVLDIEQGAGNLGRWALDWCRRVEEVAGFPPLIYTGAWFSDPHGFAGVPELARYGLWLADYGATAWPPAPAPWPGATFWQFTDKATVPGISTPADGNRFAGTPADLLLWGKPGTLPPDDPFAAWVGLVGSGLLELMAQDNTYPAQSRSTWLPLGSSPAEVEQCLGANMVNYVWSLTTNQGARYGPIA
jgi:GH25 family lysozyme M1 (1,4-beta-N-acetylmuramidase)